MTPSPTSNASPLADVAVRVDPKDNCAVVKFGVNAGTRVEVSGEILTISEDIGPGHRFAVEAIAAGEFVRQYAPTHRNQSRTRSGCGDHRSDDEQRCSGGSRPSGRSSFTGACIRLRRGDRHLPWFPPAGRKDWHPKLSSGPADLDVFEPRGQSDLNDRGIPALVKGKVPQR